jgi:hypothetical protein
MPTNTSSALAACERLVAQIRREGYAFVTAAEGRVLLELPAGWLDPLVDSWSRLPRDGYLRDGGRYRARRHSCFIQDLPAGTPSPTPHRPHWQGVAYNALHGGIERWYEPIEPAVVTSAAWAPLLGGLGCLFREVRDTRCWFIEAHQFRIDTAGGIGRPTPEGAHRDGVDFVAVILIERAGLRGGETHVFDAHGPAGVRFTIQEPGAMLLMDDTRVIHETTPIQPEGAADGHRDTLVVTYRAGGFQSPANSATSSTAG